jgi:NTP pyrophosphatase (non-canonical NTP hydrolase)
MKQSKTIEELSEILLDFEKENWVAPRDKKSVTRHITQHMAKLMGKLGTITEKWEHGFEADLAPLKEEVIPDLLYYALNLSMVHSIDLESAFLKRLKINERKVNNWKKKGLVAS